MVIERLVVRHLYDRPLDTIVATWGISLIATQGVLILLGSTMQGVGTPFGSFTCRRLFLFDLPARADGRRRRLLLALYLLFYTHPLRHRLRARRSSFRTWREALGVDTRLIYSLTFGLGAALAGLTGGLYAPTMTMVPTHGRDLHRRSLRHRGRRRRRRVPRHRARRRRCSASSRRRMTSWQASSSARSALLVAVIIVIRVLPGGISGWHAERARHDGRSAKSADRGAGLAASLSHCWRAADARPRAVPSGPASSPSRSPRRRSIRSSPTATPSATPPISSPGSSWRWGSALVWGYGGALSFGQTAFFGLAGYAYGMLTINFGAAYGFTLLAVVLAVAVRRAVRARARLFPVLRRISGVFLGIVTLSVTLVFETLHGADRRPGMADRRGAAQRLQRHVRHAAADHPLAGRRHRAVPRHRALLPAAGAAGRLSISACACW